MLVSWNWLKDYVALDMTPAELAERLMMAGLNHESTEQVGDDHCIDLEVTSNRPDCLGHIGVARETAVLFNRDLKVPSAALKPGKTPASELAKVSVSCPDLCPRYTARVIRGVKIAPSPKWLVDRLQAIGVASINNVVDVTNYVLMECGQPLHAFDLARLNGREIRVRRAEPNEQFAAIDHKTYSLDGQMCVIADATRAVALGGVMGGVDSEVSDATKDLLIESAMFSPLSIRTTSRKLTLRSPSSYRFERGVDPEGVDWASRRCCELILELASGELADGVIEAGPKPTERETVSLRFAQVARILGIDISEAEVRRILLALGGKLVSGGKESITVQPPSWRRDLTREIDLIEEVARIHGYDKIPEDAQVPMAASHRTDHERVLAKVRQVMTAAGFDEALTASVVPEKWSAAFSPWSDASPLVASTPMLKGADRLRRSLIPSLLDARRLNESVSNPVVELFETAKIYLPQPKGLPVEQWTLAATSGGDFLQIKGVVESLVASLRNGASIETIDFSHELLEAGTAAELKLNGKRLGFLGAVSQSGLKAFGLRGATTVLELNIGLLAGIAELIPQSAALSQFPAIERDLNLIVDEAIRWADLAGTVRSAAGDMLEKVDYLSTYRDAQKDGPNTKRLHFSLTLRSKERTMTSEEADQIRDSVVAAATKAHSARLLSAI